MELSLNHISVLLMLTIGLIEDLRLRKVRNLVLAPLLTLALSLVLAHSLQVFDRSPASLSLFNLDVFLQSGLSLAWACALFVPLYAIRAVGAGDVKLMMVVALLLNAQQVQIIWFSSLIWGLIFGVILLILQNRIQFFLINISNLSFKILPEQNHSHKMPFTYSLLLGTLTAFMWKGVWI